MSVRNVSARLVGDVLAGTFSALIACSGASAQGLRDNADAQRCACEASRSNGGRLSEIEGDVSVLSGAGYSPASSGQPVGLGARIMVGQGAGNLTFGRNCNISLEPNTNYDVTANGQKLCLRISRNVFTPQVAPTASVAPAAIGGALALGGVAAGVIVGTKGGNGGTPYLPLSK